MSFGSLCGFWKPIKDWLKNLLGDIRADGISVGKVEEDFAEPCTLHKFDLILAYSMSRLLSLFFKC